MSKLEELILKLCPDGVLEYALRDCCKVLKGKQLNKKELLEEGCYPAYNGGITYSGFTNKFNAKENTTIISQGGASAGFVQFVTCKFWANAHCYYLEPNLNIVNNKYLFYCVKNQQSILMDFKHGAGIPALKAEKLESISILVPPIEIQSKIVRILDRYTEINTKLISELKLELEARHKQYECYRDKLLTFGNDVEWISISKCTLKSSNIKWSENKEKQFKYIDLSSVNRDNNQICDCKDINSDNAPSRAQQIVKKNDVIFGTTRPMLKRFSLITQEYNNQICSTGFSILRAKIDKVLPKWLFYLISTKSFYEHIEKYQKGASYPAITDKEIKSYKIPVPSLEEQQRIIDILDKYNVMYKDITTTIKAEIELRQKQYEYYRDKILTFKVKK